jgi:hypothetical protein
MGALDRGSVPVSGPARVVRALICVAILVAAALACTSSTPASESAAATAATPSPSPSPTAAPAADTSPALIHRHLSGSGYGISFDYPADWQVVPGPFMLAYFTNGDAGSVAPTCCHLNPNQLAIGISAGSSVPVDIGTYKAPGADIKRVDDWLVIKQTMAAAPSSFDAHTLWLIGRPGGETVYSVSAIFRGPDLAPMQAEVEAFVDSIRLDPEPTASPS